MENGDVVLEPIGTRRKLKFTKYDRRGQEVIGLTTE